jgi:hypothetical protein
MSVRHLHDVISPLARFYKGNLGENLRRSALRVDENRVSVLCQDRVYSYAPWCCAIVAQLCLAVYLLYVCLILFCLCFFHEKGLQP